MATRNRFFALLILAVLLLSKLGNFPKQTYAEVSNILFESSFEDQFDDWNGTKMEHEAYVETGNQSVGFPVHHGNNSMKSASAAVSGSQSWAYRTFKNVTEVYVRAYVYFPEFWTYPNAWAPGYPPAWWLYFMILAPEYPIPRSSAGQYILTQLRAMYFTSSQSGQEGWYFQGTYYNAQDGNRAYLPDPEYPDQWTLSPRQWYCVEWYNKVASAKEAKDGIWRLWVDGQIYYNFTDLDNRDQDYPWFGALMVGNYEVPPSTNGWEEQFPSMHMDSLKVSTEYVGPDPIIDETPPHVDSPAHEPETAMPYQNVTVSVNVTDELSGVREVILSYSASDGANWINTTMTKAVLAYRGIIFGYPEGTNISYKILAYDNKGNVAINNNTGLYYVYTVIPEFSTLPMLLTTIFVTTTLIVLRVHIKSKHPSSKARAHSDEKQQSEPNLVLCV